MTGMSQTDSKCLKMMQMTHNDQNDSKIVPNDSNDPNVLKWLEQLQMTQNDAKWLKMTKNDWNV